METALDFYLKTFKSAHCLVYTRVKYLSHLCLFSPYGLPDLRLLLPTPLRPLVFVTDNLAHPLEVPVLLFDLPQVVLQVHRVVCLVRRRRHEQAMAADLTMTVQTVEVVRVVVKRTLSLVDSRGSSRCAR